jgi:hypothetical protein
MKKLLLIGTGFLLALVTFGVGGYALAQAFTFDSVPEQSLLMQSTTGDLDVPTGQVGKGLAPYDGWIDWYENEVLREYLWPAIAEAFGLTDEQAEAFKIVWETKQGFREELTQEEIHATMEKAMSSAIDNALADGAITEEQAEFWRERVEQMENLTPGNLYRQRVGTNIFRRGFFNGVRFGRQMLINQQYLDDAIADAFGITIDEVQKLKSDQGLNLKIYAEAQGLSEDEFAALRKEIFTDAVNAALEDGAITGKQASWVLENMENTQGRGTWLGQP